MTRCEPFQSKTLPSITDGLMMARWPLEERGEAERKENSMNGPGVIVAGVTSGIAVSPYCAHYFLANRAFFKSSVEQWFVSTLKGDDALRIFGAVVLLCAIAGLLIGLLLAKVIQPSDGSNKGGLSLFRTPLAAGVLIPFAVAASILVAYNHSPWVLHGIVWPDFYFKNVVVYSVVIGMASAILAGFLNEREQAFGHATLLGKLAIIGCLPLAVVVGLASLAGLIGAGLLGGLAIGYCLSCPVTGVWTGSCLAIALLATQSGIFWPVYFPFAAHGGK
jgi:hypothetical protein